MPKIPEDIAAETVSLRLSDMRAIPIMPIPLTHTGEILRDVARIREMIDRAFYASIIASVTKPEEG